MIKYIVWVGEMILWKIAVWTYYPPWMLGSRFQRWWYNKNSLLQEWLHWRLSISIRKVEVEMKIQSDLVKPPTLDMAIRKYLEAIVAGSIPFPRNVYAIGRYRQEEYHIIVYKQDGKLVFDLGHLQYKTIPIEIESILRNLERYLWRTQHLDCDDCIILKYTKYWD